MQGLTDADNRSSYLITCIFVMITAAVLAEICSALPAAGSIYLYVIPTTVVNCRANYRL